MSPREERELAMDDMAEHAQHFGRTHMPMAHPEVSILPAHLAVAVMPSRNLCAEFSALPTDKLLEEAQTALQRLERAGRLTDFAIVTALVRRLIRPTTALDSALWLDLVDERHATAPVLRFDGVERRHA